ncbi:hypothetical protein L6164_026121 [Bauhinia variegata]|uniref:Uncharacterized protein n=1 Tax=Bauhinia variegata TaxID=167791 RepID=A0ACB9LPP8_BAUVA|nr:hypothetical protein L6164_026121 [Bauhinia variegata]
MAHSWKRIPDPKVDALSDRVRDLLSCGANKPDSREVNLGSPVLTLQTRTRQSAPTASGLTSTTTSSSSSSSSRSVTVRSNPVSKKYDSGWKNQSSENSSIAAKSPRSSGSARKPRTVQARSDSGNTQPLKYLGQSSVNSPPRIVLPAGNICPSGKIGKTGMASNQSSRTDVLGSSTGIYGYGSIMRGGTTARGYVGDTTGVVNAKTMSGGSVNDTVKRAMQSVDPEELNIAGNEHCKKGQFIVALSLYDQAIALSPTNAAYWSNRAATLAGLGRMAEAVRECEEAVRLDPYYLRAHQRLASLFIRLGHLENARKHLFHQGLSPDPSELQKLELVEKHVSRCTDVRRRGDWICVLREIDAAIAAGADSSPHLLMCRAEALLKLHRTDDAESSLLNISQLETPTNSSSTKYFGMFFEAYSFFVRAKIDLALGRIENAITAAEKAVKIEPRNVEVVFLHNNVKMVARARARGNDLFKSKRYNEACSAYGEGLKVDTSNSVLYCNRAACWFKAGQWEKSIEDCNHALHFRPNYTKALLRRATANSKLERWVEAVKDYEILRRKLLDDKEVAEALFHAQVALKKSRGEEVHNLKFGGDVEVVSGLDQFRDAISLPGVFVVYFEIAPDTQCKQISSFVDTLCHRYPSINFLRVNIQECPAVATAENVHIVPTFKIYKNGSRVKEIICPSRDMLEHSVRHYSILNP